MKVINLLDEKTINKIAAGEVVEKPLSIVKELVENSIDSGATEITIEVKKDPLRYIRISDNGVGILSDDVEDAFLRHATSKIQNINDVECIRSLGFRGEALSSISAISKVEMITKPKEQEIGQRVVVEGGKFILREDAGCPNGTIITIRDVFFNTPARLKFLKSTSRELSSITDLVEKIALSNIDISFRYKIDDKLIFLTPGKGDLKSIIRTIFGKNAYNNLISIEEENEHCKISGYIGNTSLTKGNRSWEIIFVNGRIVKSPLISSAIEKAYKSMLPINKFPFFIISLQVNPRFIDVNVHPTKAEIKFQDDSLIYKEMYKAIKVHIEKEINIKDAFEEEVFKENVEYVQNSIDYNLLQNKSIDKTTSFQLDKEDKKINMSNSVFENICSDTLNYYTNNHQNPNIPKENISGTNNTNIAETPYIPCKSSNNSDLKETTKQGNYVYEECEIFKNKCSEEENRIPELRILGQVNSTFIIAEGNKEMFIVDQHAAHERIYYEKYMKEFNNFSIKSQPILVPIVEELTLSQKQLLLSNIENFKRIGFTIEDFGGSSVAIREVPIIYGNPDPKELFNEILEDILETKEKKLTSCVDKIIYSMACRSSVKAGDNLNIKEIEKLIENLRLCESPYTCPHGRPTIIKMSYLELEKKFKRIQ